MATVMHGRRKGQSKAVSERHDCNTNQRRMMTLPDGTDLRQVTVLTKQDWERIERELNQRNIEEQLIMQIREEREEQKRRSKEIIKNWTNTIEGQRQKKLQARKIREEKEEEEQRLIDVEEAKIQAQKRKEALDKAKTQQYYQTDRVKNFHSALTLTEVLKEREAQIELKRLKEGAMEELDKEYSKKDRELYEKSIKADQEKARTEIEAAHRTAEFQLAQIQEHLTKKEMEKLDNLKEAEELKRLAAQYRLEREVLINVRKDEGKTVMKENLEQIEEVKKIKLLRQQEEEEEDEECRVFAAAKRKMMKLRAEKEMDIHNEKQARLDRIRDKLSVKMKQKVCDEENKLQAAVEEIEKKRLAEERAKEEKLLKQIKEQAEHRNKQMKEREESAKREKQEELELLQMRHAADQLFHQNEAEKSARRRQEAASLRNFLVDQYNERVNKQEEAKRAQLALEKANVELLEKEEAQFQEYASKVINHCREKGRNVYPLERAARMGPGVGAGSALKGSMQQRYLASDKSGVEMPHYQRDSTDEVKLQVNGNSPSKNRMGFVW